MIRFSGETRLSGGRTKVFCGATLSMLPRRFRLSPLMAVTDKWLITESEVASHVHERKIVRQFDNLDGSYSAGHMPRLQVGLSGSGALLRVPAFGLFGVNAEN